MASSSQIATWPSPRFNLSGLCAKPIGLPSLRAIAKSVANWVWQHMRQDSDKFLKRQAVKGKKGGIAKGQKNHNKRVAAQILKNEGLPLSEIARTLGVARTTIMNWKLE